MASRAPWAAHFGLARTPFGKAIAAGDLFARQAHAQATARISFCIDQILPGGRVGDEGGGGGVVQGAGQAGGDAVQPGDGVISEQGLLTTGQGHVMTQVGR